MNEEMYWEKLINVNEDLRYEIGELNNKLIEESVKSESLAIEISMLRSQLEYQMKFKPNSTEIEDLKRKNDLLQAQLKSIENDHLECARFLEENCILKEEILKLKEEIQKKNCLLNDQIYDNKKIKLLEDTAHLINQKLLALELIDNCEMKEKVFSDLAMNSNKLIQTVKNKNKEIREKNIKIEELSIERDLLFNENSSLNSSLSRRSTPLRENRSRIDRLEKQCEEKDEKRVLIENLYQKTLKKLEQIEYELENTNKINHDLQDKLRVLNNLCSKQQETLSISECNEEKLLRKLEKYKSLLISKEKQFSELCLEKINLENKEKIGIKAQEDIEKLKNQIIELKNSHLKNLKIKEDIILELAKANKASLNEIQVLKAKASNYKQDIELKDKKISQIEYDYNISLENSKSHNENFKILEEKLRQEIKEKNEMSIEMQKLNTQLDESIKKYNENLSINEDMKLLNIQLDKRVSEATEKYHKVNQELSKYFEKYNNSLETIKSMKNQKSKLNEELSELRKEIISLKNQLEISESIKNNLEKKYELYKQSSLKVIEGQKQNITNLETEINNLRQNINEIKEESIKKIDKLQDIINDQQHKNIEAILAKKREKILKLKEKIIEVNNSNKELFASVQQLKDFLQNQIVFEDSVEEDEEGGKKEIEREFMLLKEKYSSLAKDYDDLYKKLEALTEENKNLKEVINEKERKLNEWNFVMKSMNKRF
ncbi:unnamed protein product [Blepharisma stoltei]|uniref:Uncharacterized protein n=1 Tax=Blepharisma stoltei TaxID=1481888 RepID=A0AAU9IQK4_9CILI|nr:unnamed protein product [Blepharisma stoltei]